MKKGYYVSFLYKGKPHFSAGSTTRTLTTKELRHLEREARLGLPKSAEFQIVIR